MSKLVIVGTVAFDAIQTPYGKTDKILGGAATFIGLAASQFDIDGAIVSVVGGDFPKEYIDMLEDKGLNISSLEVVENGKTFFWSGRYHNDMNSRDTLVTELNVLENFQPIVPESYKDAKILVLGNLHPAVQSSVLDQMSDSSTLVILDTMNFWIDGKRDALIRTLGYVDILVINEAEVRQLADEANLVKASRAVLAMGPKTLVVKRGEYGVLVFTEHSIFSAPAYPLEEVFDPTGAGDTFAGGFMGYLAATNNLSDETIRKATVFGSVMASFTVEDFSAFILSCSV